MSRINLVVFKVFFLSVYCVIGIVLNGFLFRVGKNDLSNVVFWFMMFIVFFYFYCKKSM